MPTIISGDMTQDRSLENVWTQFKRFYWLLIFLFLNTQSFIWHFRQWFMRLLSFKYFWVNSVSDKVFKRYKKEMQIQRLMNVDYNTNLFLYYSAILREKKIFFNWNKPIFSRSVSHTYKAFLIFSESID